MKEKMSKSGSIEITDSVSETDDLRTQFADLWYMQRPFYLGSIFRHSLG